MRFEDLGGRLLGGAADFASHVWPHESLGIGGDVAASLVELSLSIVREGRGPMPLWDFSLRLRRKLGMPPVPSGTLCDAVKAANARTTRGLGCSRPRCRGSGTSTTPATATRGPFDLPASTICALPPFSGELARR